MQIASLKQAVPSAKFGRYAMTNSIRIGACLSAILLIVGMNSCVGVGYEKRFTPLPEEGWETTIYNDSGHRQNVRYECQETTLRVNDFWLSSRLLATGILLPIIPAPISGGSNENVELDLYVYEKILHYGKSIIPDKQSIYIKTDNREIIKAINFKKEKGIYRYEFPVDVEQTQNFHLLFDEPFLECGIPPLKFEKQTFFRGGPALSR